MREKFVSLTDIDFSACENVRNRNLAILKASKLKLRSIAIGHIATVAYGKPRITNSVRFNSTDSDASSGCSSLPKLSVGWRAGFGESEPHPVADEAESGGLQRDHEQQHPGPVPSDQPAGARFRAMSAHHRKGSGARRAAAESPLAHRLWMQQGKPFKSASIEGLSTPRHSHDVCISQD